jgi:hypothetical protein
MLGDRKYEFMFMLHVLSLSLPLYILFRIEQQCELLRMWLSLLRLPNKEVDIFSF